MEHCKTVPALGRSANIGDFYDAKTDQFLPGCSIFPWFGRRISRWKCSETEQLDEVLQVDDSSETFQQLGIDICLLLNLLSGKVKIKRHYEEFLSHSLKDPNLIRKDVFHGYKSSKVKMETTKLLGSCFSSLVNWNDLHCNPEATHFVGEIIYGLNSFASFSYPDDDTDVSKAPTREQIISKYVYALKCSIQQYQQNLTLEIQGEVPIIRVYSDDKSEPRLKDNIPEVIEYIKGFEPKHMVQVKFVLYEKHEFLADRFSPELGLDFHHEINFSVDERKVKKLYSKIQQSKIAVGDFERLFNECPQTWVSNETRTEMTSSIVEQRALLTDFQDRLHGKLTSIRTRGQNDSLYDILKEGLKSPEAFSQKARIFLQRYKPVKDKIHWLKDMQSRGVRILRDVKQKDCFVFMFNNYVTSRDHPHWQDTYKLFCQMMSEHRSVQFCMCEHETSIDKNNTTCVAYYKDWELIKRYGPGKNIPNSAEGGPVSEPSLAVVVRQAEPELKKADDVYQLNNEDDDTLPLMPNKEHDNKIKIVKESKKNSLTLNQEQYNTSQKENVESKSREGLHEITLPRMTTVNENINKQENFAIETERILETKTNGEGITDSESKATGVPNEDDMSINIVLIGETGVGKSTFINAFANYLTFSNLEEGQSSDPIALIYSEFLVMEDDGALDVIRFGQPDSNERTDPGQSRTQSCKSYTFPWKERRLRLIDTPGMSDTGGAETDNEHVVEMIKYLSNYPKIHGICFLLKPNLPRMTIPFRYCLQELLKHLHHSACSNIVFVFTNTRCTFYRPGDTFRVLEQLLRELNEKQPEIRLELTPDRYFCLDNEAFRFLVMLKNSKEFEEDDVYSFKKSWEKSASESRRLVEYVTSMEPHVVSNSLRTTQTKCIIRDLMPVLSRSTLRLQQKIIKFEQQERDQQKGPNSSNEITSTTQTILKLEEEQRVISSCRAEFYLFLKLNSVTWNQDETTESLDSIIKNEKNKQGILQDEDREKLIAKMETVKGDYEQIVLESQRRSEVLKEGVFSMGNIDQIITRLQGLEECGEILSRETKEKYQSFEDITVANEVEYKLNTT